MLKKIKKMLQKMADKNEKRYGKQKLDCCGVNKDSSHTGLVK